MYYENNWDIHKRWPTKKPRVRLKRKERLTWQGWLGDWFRALRAKGWVCRNKGITPNRIKLTNSELADMDVLFFQKGDAFVFTYPSVETVPWKATWGSGFEDYPTQKANKVIRIVRGRRPDAKRGITRGADDTASRIIPNRKYHDKESFLVDFDSGLFAPDGRGDWIESQDEEAKAVYDDYLAASPHLNSFRTYHQTSKELTPHDFLIQEMATPVGKTLETVCVLED